MLVRFAAAAAFALLLAQMAPPASALATRGGPEATAHFTLHADAEVAAPARKGPCGDGLIGRFSVCIFAGFGGAGLEPEGIWAARIHGPSRLRAVRPALDLVARFDMTFRRLARAPPPRPVPTTA